jgi:hypothetical protein
LQKVSPPPWFDTRTLQPVSSRMDAQKSCGNNSCFGSLLNPPLTPYTTSEVALLSCVKMRWYPFSRDCRSECWILSCHCVRIAFHTNTQQGKTEFCCSYKTAMLYGNSQGTFT